MADTMTLEQVRSNMRDAMNSVLKDDTRRMVVDWYNAIDAAIKQHEQDKLDAARMEWYFGPSDKKDWLYTCMQGMCGGWGVGQWRSAIDSAMAKESSNG